MHMYRGAPDDEGQRGGDVAEMNFDALGGKSCQERASELVLVVRRRLHTFSQRFSPGFVLLALAVLFAAAIVVSYEFSQRVFTDGREIAFAATSKRARCTVIDVSTEDGARVVSIDPELNRFVGWRVRVDFSRLKCLDGDMRTHSSFSSRAS